MDSCGMGHGAEHYDNNSLAKFTRTKALSCYTKLGTSSRILSPPNSQQMVFDNMT